MNKILNMYTTFPLDKKLSELVGKYGGVVQAVQNVIVDVDDPQIYFSVAVPNNPKIFQPEMDGLIEEVTSGVGETEESANNSAVGEAVERYCSGYVQKNRLLFGAYKKSAKNYMAIDDYINNNHSEDSRIEADVPLIYGWVYGENLTKAEKVLVPAAIVWDTYKPILPQETYLTHGQVSGSACGRTQTEASINGLLEVIERDSFMITWLNKLAVSKIDVYSFPKVKEIFGEFFQRDSFELHLVDTTTDIGIPSVFGIMKSADGKLYVGGSARIDMESAVIKTLLEITQLYIGNKNIMYSTTKARIEANAIKKSSDRIQYYLQQEAHKNLDFLYKSQVIKSYVDYKTYAGNEQQKLTFIIEKLKAANLDSIIVDVTTEDVKSVGLSVVKAVIPGTVPLIYSENEKQLNNRRIFDLPVKLGYSDTALHVAELNTNPHPFP